MVVLLPGWTMAGSELLISIFEWWGQIFQHFMTIFVGHLADFSYHADARGLAPAAGAWRHSGIPTQSSEYVSRKTSLDCQPAHFFE